MSFARRHRRKLLLVYVLAASAGVMAAWYLTSPGRTLSHDGKTLNEWLDVLDDTRPINTVKADGGKTFVESREAFLQIGEWAAPPLAWRLKAKPSFYETHLFHRLPAWMKARLPAPRSMGTMNMIRNRSYSVLRTMGPAARRAVPQLRKQLARGDTTQRGNAAALLGSIGPDAVSAVPLLAGALEDPDRSIRLHACDSLGKIGCAPAIAVPALQSALENGRVPFQDAVISLGQFGPAAAAAVPLIEKGLTNEVPQIRSYTARTLGRIGPASAPTVDALTAALRDRWWYVRENAAIALGRIGAKAGPALPLLETLSQADPNQDVRAAAEEAIRRIEGPLQEGKREAGN
ncbi:MAG TPA: HEAT repeat domain-containing protein [Methylomirabilota bacterium]|nr:HEAT repeat domain-containing protein [Methylomirabilota bacterium]